MEAFVELAKQIFIIGFCTIGVVTFALGSLFLITEFIKYLRGIN